MSLSNKERSIGLAQFLVIIVVAVALFLGWGFGKRVLDTLQLAQADAAADQQLREAQDANAKLKELKANIDTDDWVEKYVRTYWHWTRDNETIFVPAATLAPTPTPPQVSTPAPPRQKSFWEEWLDALFPTP